MTSRHEMPRARLSPWFQPENENVREWVLGSKLWKSQCFEVTRRTLGFCVNPSRCLRETRSWSWLTSRSHILEMTWSLTLGEGSSPPVPPSRSTVWFDNDVSEPSLGTRNEPPLPRQFLPHRRSPGLLSADVRVHFQCSRHLFT